MIISQPSPEYTELARTDNVEGVVTVGLVVDEHGLPQHVKLLRGLGDGLDEKALDAAKKYVFKPGMENSKPVAVWLNVEVKFQLAASPVQSQGPIGGSQGAGPELAVSPNKRPLQTTPDGQMRVSAGVIAGNLISKVDPVYPEIAKASHVQGAVILHAIISKDGTVERLDVISGNGMLVNAARDAVSQWTYKPYLLNGQPTEVETSITVNFSLADSAVSQGQSPVASEAVDGVKQIGGDVIGPIPIYQPEPEYTAEAKKAKFMGVVTVSIIVDKNGIPQNVHVTRGVGMGLDEKAVEAVKLYKFKPGMENDRPVAVYMNIEVNFEIF
jgi:TonB family protein